MNTTLTPVAPALNQKHFDVIEKMSELLHRLEDQQITVKSLWLMCGDIDVTVSLDDLRRLFSGKVVRTEISHYRKHFRITNDGILYRASTECATPFPTNEEIL